MKEQKDALRIDAQANRDRLIEVARAALAADPQAPLSAIGKAAGVGQGTLYRHFPNREALVIAVYRKEIDALVALAPALLKDHPALEAFRLWCLKLVELGNMKRDLAEVIHAAASEQDFQQTYWPMVEAVATLMNACESAGSMQAGGDPSDVLLLLSVLWRLPPAQDADAKAARVIQLILKGLGAGTG